jgi:hypothetical protein
MGENDRISPSELVPSSDKIFSTSYARVTRIS